MAVPQSGGQAIIAFISVADGHGSHEYLRSQIGSRKAVDAAYQVCWDYLMRLAGPDSRRGPGDLRLHHELAERIPSEIDKKWRADVSEHLRANPLTDAEQQVFDELPADVQRRMSHLVSVYGTTLLAVMTTPEFIFYAQNGDGDILVVEHDGRIRRALPGDARLIGNETTSMANENAWRDFRIALDPVGSKPPLMIMAATDGYSNSFGNEKDFLQVPADLLASFRAHGEEWTLERLPGWLEETSAGGSTDDISVAIIWRDAGLARDAAMDEALVRDDTVVTESPTGEASQTEG